MFISRTLTNLLHVVWFSKSSLHSFWNKIFWIQSMSFNHPWQIPRLHKMPADSSNTCLWTLWKHLLFYFQFARAYSSVKPENPKIAQQEGPGNPCLMTHDTRLVKSSDLLWAVVSINHLEKFWHFKSLREATWQGPFFNALKSLKHFSPQLFVGQWYS